MIYLYDFFFLIVVLSIRRCLTAMLENDLTLFIMTRERVAWLDYLVIVILGMMYMPYHSATESIILLPMSVITKWMFDNNRFLDKKFNQWFKVKPNPEIKYFTTNKKR